jgi:TolB-like protein/DNA-binding winged helix-turn-helix (wHTH) protein/Tfp pilus assembly protein PilF
MPDTRQTNGVYEFGPYRLDPEARILLRGADVVPLTPKVLDTLVVLVRSAGHPVSKAELLRSVWPDTFVEESNLAQNISVLRKSLGPAPGGGAYIETISKRGYRFVAGVSPTSAPPEPKRQIPTVSAASALAKPQPQSPMTVESRRFNRLGAVVLAIIVVGGTTTGWWYSSRHRTASPAIHSLAVLPLKNLSGDPQQDYFADGITELLTGEISKTLPVRVVSRTSAMTYRGKEKPLPEIARELNVDLVIEGSVIRSGTHLRVTAQLIDALKDRHLWAETYDRDVVDTLTLQQEIARAVSHQIGIAEAGSGQRKVAPVNRDAFEAYLRARYYLDQRTGPEVGKAVSWFQKAIESDPAYAPPYAGLADCYNQQGTVMIGAKSPADSRKLAMAAANRALEIDPDLAEAHAALAYSNLYDWNWARARQGFERAIALNPNYAPAHLWFAHYLTARGEFDRGQQEVRLAADLDPLSPIIQTQIAWLLGHARRFPEAIAQYRKVLVQYPDYQWALWSLGGALLETGDYGAAIQTFEQAAHVNRTASMLGSLAWAYGRAGRKQDAEKLLKELQSLSEHSYVPPHAMVHVYLGLGDADKVFEWMEKSYQERSNSLLWLGSGALFDPVRSDPRFEAYLRKVGLK